MGFFITDMENYRLGMRCSFLFQNSHRLFSILWVLLLSAISVNRSFSQGPDRAAGAQWEIAEIEFRGNKAIPDDILRESIVSKETPGAISKFLYRTLGEKFGSNPEYYDAETFAEDSQRLLTLYQNNGYYQTVIENHEVFDSAGKTVNLQMYIEENRPSYIDSVAYFGLDSLAPALSSRLMAGRMIRRGMVYESARASGENGRVLEFLENNGYPAPKYDALNSGAYRYASSNNFFLKLAFVTGKRYKFGEIAVHVEPPRADITDELSLRHLDFHTGDVFSRERILSSERSLNRLGIFESARIDHRTNPDSSSSSVPVDIYVRPQVLNDLSPEFLVSDEGGFFNLGIGIGYTNRNFFGDARTFNAHTRIRTQDIHRWNFDRVFEVGGLRDVSVKGTAEIQFQLLQPYFFSRTLSGSWTSSISAEKQETYILSILRNRIGLSNQFALYTYGFFDWTLERVSPEIIQDTIETRTILNVLRQEDQPQFNSILTLTLQRDKTNNIFSPTEGFFHSISVEESGILPKLLPDLRTGLPFTQYYKVTLLGRWYHDLTKRHFNILGWKLKSGYQNKYGESRQKSVRIPLNRRFFAGGSGSVRGWRARELGAMPDELIQFGGNFIFEGSVEMRVSHFQGFGKFLFLHLENLLGVYFLDAGNIWSDIVDFRFKDVAVATGVGLRYETFFGPFRIDYGFRVYDPKETPGKQTILQRKFFGETLKNGVFNFGIGHAF